MKAYARITRADYMAEGQTVDFDGFLFDVVTKSEYAPGQTMFTFHLPQTVQPTSKECKVWFCSMNRDSDDGRRSLVGNQISIIVPDQWWKGKRTFEFELDFEMDERPVTKYCVFDESGNVSRWSGIQMVSPGNLLISIHYDSRFTAHTIQVVGCELVESTPDKCVVRGSGSIFATGICY